MTLHNRQPDGFRIGRFVWCAVIALTVFAWVCLLSGCDIIKPIEGMKL